MTDIAVPHVWVTPAGTITFNDGSADQYYLNACPGLEGKPIRAPSDKVPYGHGRIRHPAWDDARYWNPQGSLLILSTRSFTGIQAIRNEMSANLREAYESCANDPSTWTWTPLGQAERTLSGCYRDETPIEFTHVDNYQVLDFAFAMVAPDPDWA